MANRGEGKTIDDMYFTDRIECIVAKLPALEVTTSKRSNCEEMGLSAQIEKYSIVMLTQDEVELSSLIFENIPKFYYL